VTCYCGTVKIEAEGDPAMCVACHCDDCRRHCGSIFQAAYLFPADKVKVSGGTITKGISGMSHRQSCAKCGGIAYDDKKHTPMNMIMVPAGLSKEKKFEPSMHLMYGMRIYDCNDGKPKYKDFPTDMGGSGETIEEDGGLFGGIPGAGMFGKMGDFMPDMPEMKMPEMPDIPMPDMPDIPMPDVPGMPTKSPFSFASGLPDCCQASPELYKTIADIEGVARLVEMTFPPGAKDVPHEHPIHSMYFLTDVKLKISGPPTPTKLGEEGGVAELPAGAAPIFPAMAHQVENVGDKEGKAIFVEPYPNCKPCGDPEGYVSPFQVSPECYKLVAEDDSWITGVMTMEVGAKDILHHHRDHLIFVEQGDGVTIYPDGDESNPMVVPLQPGAGIPAPMSAPPFAKHTLLNSGSVPLKMIFFEAKK